MIYKCKMCGGNLEINPGDKVVTCDFCSSQQTIPNTDDEKVLNLYNRANTLLKNYEFDKASMIFEKINSDCGEQAEAYWGICLCRYGIEYVDDPKTNSKVPTCHRINPISILNDSDYLNAIRLADVVAKELYVKQAEEIDAIQKRIIEISNNEKPYDIFICYKETDELKNRTNDSVIGQSLYDALTNIGYKVFFARISLEDKIGREYEPFIYSALTTSRIMLVIGTKLEYFTAPWVKNEWNRFIHMGSDKVVIPCYKDMDPYELPDEFMALQSQDLNKLGYEQDLIRGIGKILPIKKDNGGNASEAIKIQLAQCFAECRQALLNEDRDEVKKQVNIITQLDPSNPDAYFYLFLVDNEIYTASYFDQLAADEFRTTEYFYENNLDKAIELATGKQKELYQSYKDAIVRNREENNAAEIEDRYKQLVISKRSAKTTQDYVDLIEGFSKLGGYKKSETHIDEIVNDHYQDIAKEYLYTHLIKNIKYYLTYEEEKNLCEGFMHCKDYKHANEYIEDFRKHNGGNYIAPLQEEVDRLVKKKEDLKSFSSRYIELEEELKDQRQSLFDSLEKLILKKEEIIKKADDEAEENIQKRNQLLSSIFSNKKMGMKEKRDKINNILSLNNKIAGEIKECCDNKEVTLIDKEIKQIRVNFKNIKNDYDEKVSKVDEELGLVEIDKEIKEKLDTINMLSGNTGYKVANLWDKPRDFYRVDESGSLSHLMALGTYPQELVTDKCILLTLKDLVPNKEGVIEWCGLKFKKMGDDEYYVYTPVLWKVIENDEFGNFYLIARSAIDCKPYILEEDREDCDGKGSGSWNKKVNADATNYEHSYIRKWLNKDFIDACFNEEEKEFLRSINVDNSQESACEYESNFECDDTFDKVTLPSLKFFKNNIISVDEDNDESDLRTILAINERIIDKEQFEENFREIYRLDFESAYDLYKLFRFDKSRHLILSKREEESLKVANIYYQFDTGRVYAQNRLGQTTPASTTSFLASDVSLSRVYGQYSLSESDAHSMQISEYVEKGHEGVNYILTRSTNERGEINYYDAVNRQYGSENLKDRATDDYFTGVWGIAPIIVVNFDEDDEDTGVLPVVEL